MTEVSEWFTATQHQQKLSLHSRKRKRSLEETHSQKSHAVSVTWSTPQFLECSGQGERESGNGRKPHRASGHKQEGNPVGIVLAMVSDSPLAAPSGVNRVVEPSIAQPSNMPLSLIPSAHSHAMTEGRKLRPSIFPACQDLGVSSAAFQAKASCVASAPAGLPSAVATPDVLPYVPARRHKSAGQKPMMVKPLAYPPSLKQAGQRSHAHSEPGLARDNSVPATSEQWGWSAGGTTSATGRSRSAAEPAARSSSSSGSGGAANATQALMQMWTNPMQPPVQSCLPSLEDLACGNTTGLRPEAITKVQLDTARPLHQVSRQFVPLVCGRVVAIMDQHAAAERIRLEQLQQEVIDENGYPRQSDSVRLRPAQLLQLSPAEVQMLQHHRAHLEAWGWQFAHTDSSRATGALVTHAAAVLGTPLNSTELQSFLQQLSQTDGVARVPQAVHRLLVSKACHSAIRFGDVLSADQCEQLVQALRKTVSWHCCAHGRPTIVPLVDLALLQSLLQMRRKGS